MRIEVEITESELKDALAKHLRAAVADRVNWWGAREEIKKLVAAKYKEVTAAIVAEMLSDAPKIREQVHAAMASKIKGQFTAAMKCAK